MLEVLLIMCEEKVLSVGSVNTLMRLSSKYFDEFDGKN
jgi:hypothetical protein